MPKKEILGDEATKRELNPEDSIPEKNRSDKSKTTEGRQKQENSLKALK